MLSINYVIISPTQGEIEMIIKTIKRVFLLRCEY